MYKYILVGYIFSLCLSYIDFMMDSQRWTYLYVDKNGQRNAFRQKKFRQSGNFADQKVIIKKNPTDAYT